MVKKKILILPTTDHTVDGFFMSYEGIAKEYELYFILDGVNIRKHHDVTWAQCLPVSSVKSFTAWGRAGKLFTFILNGYYLRAKLHEYFTKFKFDVVVVSNDCPMIQDYAIQIARKKGLPVITHQLASGIVPSSTGINMRQKLFRLLLRLISRTKRCQGFGGKSDYVFIMGDVWRSVVSERVNNASIKLVSNGFYYYFRNSFEIRTKNTDPASIRRNVGLASDKPCLVFFSQPFFEIGLFNKEQSLAIYQAVNMLAIKLSNEFQLCFKPHPQEHLYRTFEFNEDVLMLHDLTPDESLLLANMSVSVSSTMSLQSKMLGIPSFFLEECFIPQKYREQSRFFFNSSITELDKWRGGGEDKENTMNDSIYMGEKPHIILRALFEDVFDANS